MAYPKNIVECILKLFPDAKVDEDFVCTDRVGSGLEISEWNIRGLQTNTKPTEEELNAVSDEVQAEYDAQEYARKREAEYPSIAELTVALYDTDDKAALETKRAAVKKKWPKDNSGPVE